MTIGTVLRRAAELVERRWLQGQMWEPATNGVCLVGALALASQEAEQVPRIFNDVLGWTETADRAIHAVMRVLRPEWPAGTLQGTRGHDYLAAWNDQPHRSRQDVAGLLRQAASAEDAKLVAASEAVEDIAARVWRRVEGETAVAVRQAQTRAVRAEPLRHGCRAVLIDA